MPPRSDQTQSDDKYFELMAGALHVCARYMPMLGQGLKGGQTLEQFRVLYGSDPFYAWVGLDSPLMYAAHKAAGGMTSIYRQLGIGCEWVFRSILQDSLGLDAADATWTYTVPSTNGTPRSLYLDGRIDLAHLHNRAASDRVREWLDHVMDAVLLAEETRPLIRGAVFEVRQGYKSKDSKRQNADISNASNAYAHMYVPVLLLLSTQIDSDLMTRYTSARWLPLTGTLGNDPTISTYAFCREVLGYDLAGFFERNSARLKSELESVLYALLTPQP